MISARKLKRGVPAAGRVGAVFACCLAGLREPPAGEFLTDALIELPLPVLDRVEKIKTVDVLLVIERHRHRAVLRSLDPLVVVVVQVRFLTDRVETEEQLAPVRVFPVEL